MFTLPKNRGILEEFSVSFAFLEDSQRLEQINIFRQAGCRCCGAAN